MTLLSRLFARLFSGRSEAPAAPAVVVPAPIPVMAIGDPPVMPPPSALTARDRERLCGVHSDLVRVVERARRSCDFFVIEGVRTAARQKELVAAGASKTQNSRHLTGHAVDLGPMPLNWSDIGSFRAMAKVVQAAADAEGVAIVWGGSWAGFFDGPHFELARAVYPA